MDLTPEDIVTELDRYIIGQNDAKRAVAIALRNRWRRLQIDPPLRDEILPKNILMIGPTGCGKTEIARRLARLAEAPFVKVEATRFTEVGYVGRDVEQIMRDLVDVSITLTRDAKRKAVEDKVLVHVHERILDALVGPTATPATRNDFREKLLAHTLDDHVVEIEIQLQNPNMPFFDIPGMPGAAMGTISLGDVFGRIFPTPPTQVRRLTVREARTLLLTEESDKLLNMDVIVKEAMHIAENRGIVFIDEIDKVCRRGEKVGADVSREGVQRDLLPLIEGCTIPTKYGLVRTDHVLFIASGAFHIAKPSDLLPELQGRLPVRVELASLTRDDFQRILTETEANLIRQSGALLATEGVDLRFTDDAIATLADFAAKLNNTLENIGARRLHTVVERTLEKISFDGKKHAGQTITVDHDYVTKEIGGLVTDTDMSRYIL